MSYEGYEKYSPEAQELYVTITSYSEHYETRRRAYQCSLHGPRSIAIQYLTQVVNSVCRDYKRQFDGDFTTAQRIECMALLHEQDMEHFADA